jgi:hypothetical protein
MPLLRAPFLCLAALAACGGATSTPAPPPASASVQGTVGDHLTGTFSAPVCSELLFQNAWTGTCGS